MRTARKLLHSKLGCTYSDTSLKINLKLILTDLAEKVVDEQSMELISRPLATGITNQHVFFHWSAYHSQPASILMLCLLVAALDFIVFLIYLSRVNNPAPLCKRLFRRQADTFPWSRIPREEITSLQDPVLFDLTPHNLLEPHSVPTRTERGERFAGSDIGHLKTRF